MIKAFSRKAYYRAFLTTTSDSAPVLRLGTLAGTTCLTGSLHIGATGSHVPYGSQGHGHAPFMPDAGIIGHLPTLSQERDPLLVSTSPGNLSTRHQGFAPARLRDPHLTGIFSPTLTTTAFDRCRLGWFEACSRKPTSKGLPSSSIQLRKPDGLAFVTHDPRLLFFR